MWVHRVAAAADAHMCGYVVAFKCLTYRRIKEGQ